jgi:oligopeptide transport system substrate-binding protein
MILSLWMTFPSPTHIVKNPGDPWPTVDKLAYNGPFKIESYKAKDEAVLVRNDNFAGTPANLDKITMKYIDKLDVAENAYRANQIDVTRANLTNLDVIKADPTLGKEFIQVPGVTTRAVHVNHQHKPLDNYKVRMALSQATDRENLNKVAFRGAYIPSTTWMPPSVVGQSIKEDSFGKTIGFNPETAKKNLAEAGYPNGQGFPKLVMVISDVPDRRATAEFLKEQWKKHLNIDIEVQVVDAKTRAARFSAMDYDLFPGGWTQDYPDPENWVAGLFNTGGSNNHYGVSDAKLDDLLKKALFNTNEEERRKQYGEINKLLSEDPMLAGPILYQESFNYLVKPKLHGPREQANPLDAFLAGDWNVEAWWLDK